MKFLTIFLLFTVVLTVDFVFGYPSEDVKKTSSIIIDNGVTITGLDYRPDHPPHPFSNFGKDAKCNGYCVCYGNNCNCSCYGCSLGECVLGCTVAC